MPEQNWKDELIEAGRQAGIPVVHDEADAVLIAEARNIAQPGSQLERLADQLAADLEKHAPGGRVSRETCMALIRAAANLRGLALVGASPVELLAVQSVAAARLEMRAKP